MAKANSKSKIDLLLGFDVTATKEVTPSQRLKDMGVSLTIRPLTEADLKQARSSGEGKDGKLDEFQSSLKTIELALVDPSPAELMTATAAATQEVAIKKIFNVGERVALTAEIMKLSGFAPVEEEVDELKN